jgi:predicted transcriptional regulator
LHTFRGGQRQCFPNRIFDVVLTILLLVAKFLARAKNTAAEVRPMPRKEPQLSRRERQIMEIVYRAGSATAAEVLEQLPDPPSYSAIRALLRVLEQKGHLRHELQGQRYVYLPIVSREAARRSAIRNLVSVFFGGSVEEAVATLLSQKDQKLSAEELKRLSTMIDKARKEGR